MIQLGVTRAQKERGLARQAQLTAHGVASVHRGQISVKGLNVPGLPSERAAKCGVLAIVKEDSLCMSAE